VRTKEKAAWLSAQAWKTDQVPEPAIEPESGDPWEERVLKKLSFAGPLPRHLSKIWYAVVAVVAILLAFVDADGWWTLPIGVTLGALGIAYWVAFSVKVVRQFRVGYREGH